MCPWEEACQTFPHASNRLQLMQSVPGGHSPRRDKTVAPPVTQAPPLARDHKQKVVPAFLPPPNIRLGQGRQTLHRHLSCTEQQDSTCPLQLCTPQTSSPASTTSSQSIFLVRDPKAAHQGPRTYQSPKLGKVHIVQILFMLVDTPSVVNLKIILSTYVEGQARAARSETRPLSAR